MKNQAFTLIELLVVVLIIGILAAIAVPKYQIAIGKSKYYQLKGMTKTVNEGIHLYQLSTGTYPKTITDLDIKIPVDDDFKCNIFSANDPYINCSREIFGVKVAYYIKRQGNKPYLCIAWIPDLSHPANVLCKYEAHRIAAGCNTRSCTHYY